MRKTIVIAGLTLLLAGPLAAMSVDQRRAYRTWMQQNLPKVPAWNAWQKATGALPPDVDALPGVNGLSDPLRCPRWIGSASAFSATRAMARWRRWRRRSTTASPPSSPATPASAASCPGASRRERHG